MSYRVLFSDRVPLSQILRQLCKRFAAGARAPFLGALGCIFATCLNTNVYADDPIRQPIRIGVATALSGSAAALGTDIKNALTLMNDRFGNGRYKLLFEDERCENRAAISVAHKFITIDKVKYMLGFPCNSSLLATASMYSRAGVVVVTSSATTGDVLDVGQGVFRLFPADGAGAELLVDHISSQHSKVGILTEQNEYPVMMERSFRKRNAALASPMELLSAEFRHGEVDLRSAVLKFNSAKVDAIFINANTDESFITAVKQVRASQTSARLYAVYLPASDTARKALGSAVDGFVFANLPLADQIVTVRGRELLAEFRARYGEPLSGFPVVPTSFEAYRVLDMALSSGRDPKSFIASTKFKDGFINEFFFDEHGAVQGITFEMQRIEAGKVVRMR